MRRKSFVWFSFVFDVITMKKQAVKKLSVGARAHFKGMGCYQQEADLEVGVCLSTTKGTDRS